MHPALVEAGRVICLSVSVSLLARLLCPFASRVYCDCRKSVRWRNLLLCISICTGPVDYISFSFLFFSPRLISFRLRGHLEIFFLSPKTGRAVFSLRYFPYCSGRAFVVNYVQFCLSMSCPMFLCLRMEVCYWQVIPCFFLLYPPLFKIFSSVFRIFCWSGLGWAV